MSKDRIKELLKEIPQKGEIADIRQYLPRNAMSEVAREFEISRAAVWLIARGINRNEKVYSRLTEIAIENQPEIAKTNRLAQDNRDKANELCKL